MNQNSKAHTNCGCKDHSHHEHSCSCNTQNTQAQVATNTDPCTADSCNCSSNENNSKDTSDSQNEDPEPNHHSKHTTKKLTDSIACGCGHDHDEHSGHDEKHNHNHSKHTTKKLTDSIACGCGHDHDEHSGHDEKHNHNHSNHSLTEGIACGCGGCDDEHAGHDDDHGHSHDKKITAKELLNLSIGLVVLGFAIYTQSFWLFLASYLIIGKDVLKSAVINISKGRIFDENFLMIIATFGAFLIGEYLEAVMVMIFYNIGEMLQSLAINKSKKNIESLMNIRPDYANLITEGDKSVKVSPYDVKIDDVILIKPGETVPLDGIVISGETEIDSSSLTGESLPVAISENSRVLSGSINITSSIYVKVSDLYENSTVQKILSLVLNASEKKAKSERFITRFAKYYTPAVMVIAALIAFLPTLLFGADFSEWVYKGLVFLVVSCPCALIISIPITFLGGIGNASKNGILVKGGNILEQFEKVASITFDKTGTLTKGKFGVEEIDIKEGITKEDFTFAVLLAESHSNHPIALSIKNHFDKDNTFSLPLQAQFENVSGKGVICSYNGKKYCVGNKKLMDLLGIDVPIYEKLGSVSYVSVDDEYIGKIIVNDSLKDNISTDIANLKKLGVKKVYMLTGDNENTAKEVSKAVGIDSYKANLLPDEKVKEYENLIKENDGVNIYVGDGINDAPILARSDLGIAMGAIGSDAAINASDAVLMTDDINQLTKAIKISKYTKRVAYENVIFSLGVKFLVMILAFIGHTPMILAIFADVGVSVLAILNATKTLNFKP